MTGKISAGFLLLDMIFGEYTSSGAVKEDRHGAD
jgi:hypothetical protein